MNAPFRPEPDLTEVVSRAVPRYTSYPTAPHFSPDMTPATYEGWLGRVRESRKPVSLYLHIPFCRSICTYCGCTTRAARRDEPIRAYADVMHREIALLAERLGEVQVSHLHWGGGTPNILPADSLERLVGDLGTRFEFQPGMEHAIELDPRHVTGEGAALLARIGINRASLGVQTLDPKVQIAIGRVQPARAVRDAFAHLRAAGITRLNADLMFGLPYQTEDDVVDTAREIARLRPARIAIFGYAHVPWMKTHQKLIPEDSLPGTVERLAQARAARRALIAEGYSEIGIDHFAQPDDPMAVAARAGFLERNFQGYTVDGAETLIGIGASSISRTPWGYAQNAPDTRGWERMVAAGTLPVVRGKALEGEDALRAEVIARLLCDFSVDLGALAAKHGAPAHTFDTDLDHLAGLVQAGWVKVDGERVTILKHRAELARIVASAFDRYLARAGRHSVAV